MFQIKSIIMDIASSGKLGEVCFHIRNSYMYSKIVSYTYEEGYSLDGFLTHGFPSDDF